MLTSFQIFIYCFERERKGVTDIDWLVHSSMNHWLIPVCALTGGGTPVCQDNALALGSRDSDEFFLKICSCVLGSCWLAGDALKWFKATF